MARPDYVVRKFGGEDRARRLYATISETGRNEGLDFRFDRIRRTPSSIDAHRLVRYAAGYGRADALVEALFAAHFTDGHDIGDHTVLIAIATACGMDALAVRRFLGFGRRSRRCSCRQSAGAPAGDQRRAVLRCRRHACHRRRAGARGDRAHAGHRDGGRSRVLMRGWRSGLALTLLMASGAAHGQAACPGCREPVSPPTIGAETNTRNRPHVARNQIPACTARCAARRHQHVQLPVGHRAKCRGRSGRRVAQHGGAIAERLGVPVKYVPFAKPGELADQAGNDVWDIGLIGAEPARAEKIAFTAAYAEIEATYLVPPGSPLQTIADVDKPGVRIAVTARSAYDLWLERNIKQATLVRSSSLDGAFDEFVAEKYGSAGRFAAAAADGRQEDARGDDPARPVHRGAAGGRHGEGRTRLARPGCVSSWRKPRRRDWWRGSSSSIRSTVCPSRRRGETCRPCRAPVHLTLFFVGFKLRVLLCSRGGAIRHVHAFRSD